MDRFYHAMHTIPDVTSDNLECILRRLTNNVSFTRLRICFHDYSMHGSDWIGPSFSKTEPNFTSENQA